MEDSHSKFYDIFMKIENRLGGIDERLKDVSKISRLIDEQNVRLRSLEDFKTKSVAKVGVVASIFGGFSVFIVQAVKNFFLDR